MKLQTGLPRQPTPLLTKDAAADYLGVSSRTLERWRYDGYGPPHVRVSRNIVRYRLADLERWVAGQVRASTAAQQPPSVA